MARSPREGLAEYLLVVAVLAAAAALAVTSYRHPIRRAFGVPGAATAAPAPRAASR